MIRRYVWIAPRLPAEVMSNVIEACRSIARRLDGGGQDLRELRYSLRYHLGRFDAASGVYLPGTNERGLTCATFALAALLTADVSLIEVSSWPPRAEDDPWHDGIVAKLRLTDPEHADAVAADGLCARFRPTEVAGACAVPPYPVEFAAAMSASMEVEAAYQRLVLLSTRLGA